MAEIIRTKNTTVATVAATSRKIRVAVTEPLTIEESRDLRKLLKAEEKKAETQVAGIWGLDINFARGGLVH